MLKSIGRYRCVLISVSMGQLRVNLARSPAPVPLPAASVPVTHSPNTETEVNMAIINLRDFYPYYTMDSFFEVPDEVAEAMAEFDRKEAQMVQSVTYQRETRTVPFQGRTIVLEILTPVLSPKEKERRKKEIERCLYDVFSKYRQSRC